MSSGIAQMVGNHQIYRLHLCIPASARSTSSVEVNGEFRRAPQQSTIDIDIVKARAVPGLIATL